MTDEHLTSLFVEGSAPERDAAFARRVDTRIASERRGRRLLALAVRTLVCGPPNGCASCFPTAKA